MNDRKGSSGSTGPSEPTTRPLAPGAPTPSAASGSGSRPSGVPALGVYIFAGGFTTGMAQAGFRPVAHWEGGSYGVPTFRANYDVPVWQEPANWPFDRYAPGTPDHPQVVYANPPCAPFSMAGSTLRRGRTSWLTDPRVQCLRDVYTVLERVEPKVLVWESVCQVWSRAGELVRALTRRASGLGYATTYCFTSANLHGLPQPRKRFLCFHHRVYLPLIKPTTPWRNVQDCLGIRRVQVDGRWFWTQECPVWGVPPISDKLARYARATPPGQTFQQTRATLGEGFEGDKVGFMMNRLSLKGPGKTFTSMVMNVHPVWPRWLADSELGRLSGWPDNYVWVEQEGGPVRAQMAQAVLPPVARWVGERCLAALRQARPAVAGRVRTADHLLGVYR